MVTFVFRLIPEKTSFKWDDFRNEFRANGGDSFYGAWSLSYLEPALFGMKFPENNVVLKHGICKTAELIQPNLIQLKTNFENMKIADSQAEALKQTIKNLS